MLLKVGPGLSLVDMTDDAEDLKRGATVGYLTNKLSGMCDGEARARAEELFWLAQK